MTRRTQTNSMELFRGTTSPRRDAIQHGITPFIPQQHRQNLRWDMYLRCAVHQLEGVDFKPETLLPALLTFALAGILPNKFNHYGYLIPYKGVVTPIFGYQGLIHLAYQARSSNGASLLDVKTGHILESDDYDSTADDEGMVKTHRARGARNPTKKPKDFVLAYARFAYGVPIGSLVHTHERIQVATPGEILVVDTGKNVWKSHWVRMAEKTPVRRACASGRIELGYLAGMALSAEGQAQMDPRQYMATVRGMASERQLGTAAVEALEEAHETIVDEPPGWNVDRYREAAKVTHLAMGAPDVSLEHATELSVRLGDLRAEMGCPDGFIDDIAATLMEQIQADYDRNS